MRDVFYGFFLVLQDLVKSPKKIFFFFLGLIKDFFVYFLKNKIKTIYTISYIFLISYFIFYIRIYFIEEEFLLLTIKNYNNFNYGQWILYSVAHTVLFCLWFVIGTLFGSLVYWICVFLPCKITLLSLKELNHVSVNRKEEVNKMILSSSLKKTKEKNQVKI